MSGAEYRQSVMVDCKMSAGDCKEAADYAAYNFEKDNEAEARRHVERLVRYVDRLKAHLSSLDYANAKKEEQSS